MIIVTGSITARPETFEEVLRLSLEHVERSRGEPGCVSHDVHADCQNPLRLFFYERWESEDLLRQHFDVPGSRAFIRALKALQVESTGTKIYRAEPIPR